MEEHSLLTCKGMVRQKLCNGFGLSALRHTWLNLSLQVWIHLAFTVRSMIYTPISLEKDGNKSILLLNNSLFEEVNSVRVRIFLFSNELQNPTIKIFNICSWTEWIKRNFFNFFKVMSMTMCTYIRNIFCYFYKWNMSCLYGFWKKAISKLIPACSLMFLIFLMVKS